MGKRKRSYDSDNEIRRKIEKLEEKIQKMSKRQRVIESSSSEYESEPVTTWADIHVAAAPSPPQRLVSPPPSQPASPRRAATPLATTSTANPPPAADHAGDGLDTDKELDLDILELLGDAPKADSTLGPAIHRDIATRWQDILSKGLQKETKEKLLKEYLTPSNCDLLLAPELNPETKAALPESFIKRDSSLYAKQKQIGIILSALAVTMDRVLQEDSKQNILKPLSDACRLLCDSHFCETRTRRNFVMAAVNSNMKGALSTAPRDKYLFGENVTEKLKTAKNIQKTGDDLKVLAPQKTKFNKNNFLKKNNGNNNNLNSQHRKTHPRGDARHVQGGAPQRPVTRTSARTQRDRAPPPPPPPPPRQPRSPPPRATRR